jgi:uncharacterized membrane protein
MSDAPLDIIIRPHRSLSPTGFWVVMGIVAAWSFGGGVVLMAIGAWPVIFFLGIDMALVWWAFRASYGDQRAHERLIIADGSLVVDRVSKRGVGERFSFPAYWLRVSLEAVIPGGVEQIVLSSHGKRLIVGTFLSPEERDSLLPILKEALAQARSTPLPQ